MRVMIALENKLPCALWWHRDILRHRLERQTHVGWAGGGMGLPYEFAVWKCDCDALFYDDGTRA